MHQSCQTDSLLFPLSLISSFSHSHGQFSDFLNVTFFKSGKFLTFTVKGDVPDVPAKMFNFFFLLFIYFGCTCVRVCVRVWGFWVYLFWTDHNSVWQPGLLLSRRFQQTSVSSGNSTHAAILSYCWLWQGGVVFLTFIVSLTVLVDSFCLKE